MEQKGNDDEGILGFLADDIQKELRRGKKLVHISVVTSISFMNIKR